MFIYCWCKSCDGQLRFMFQHRLCIMSLGCLFQMCWSPAVFCVYLFRLMYHNKVIFKSLVNISYIYIYIQYYSNFHYPFNKSCLNYRSRLPLTTIYAHVLQQKEKQMNSINQIHFTTDKAVLLQRSLHCPESKFIFPYILLNVQEVKKNVSIRVVDLNKICIFC